MNTNLPISQADLEAMRIGSAHAAAEREWSWMMTVDAVSGNLQASTDFRRALVKAGLLQYSASHGVGTNSLFLRLFISSKGDDKWQNRKRQKSDRQH